MRFALPAVAAITGLGLFTLAFLGQPAVYVHQAREQWDALFESPAEDRPISPDNDAVVERMAQLQQQVARLESELNARQSAPPQVSPPALPEARVSTPSTILAPVAPVPPAPLPPPVPVVAPSVVAATIVPAPVALGPVALGPVALGPVVSDPVRIDLKPPATQTADKPVNSLSASPAGASPAGASPAGASPAPSSPAPSSPAPSILPPSGLPLSSLPPSSLPPSSSAPVVSAPAILIPDASAPIFLSPQQREDRAPTPAQKTITVQAEPAKPAPPDPETTKPEPPRSQEPLKSVVQKPAPVKLPTLPVPARPETVARTDVPQRPEIVTRPESVAPPEVLARSDTSARPDTSETKSVLARLRQQPSEPGSVQQADAPPASQPRPRRVASPSTPRLTAARTALVNGRIDDARRLLQEAQLQLVFRPVETAGDDPPTVGNGAADVARALEALSANDVPLSRRYIDIALNDLAGIRSDTATPQSVIPQSVIPQSVIPQSVIPQSDRRNSGYAPAYPQR